jgi:regulator of nucleoside diphosphate kinase
MSMSSVAAAADTPPITIARKDFDYLSSLARKSFTSPITTFLKHELERARVVDTTAKQVIRLGSKVLYQDSSKTTPSLITLVSPQEADVKRQRVSVLTPIGAALLGLGKGQRIRFAMPWSEERILTVLRVEKGTMPHYDSWPG